MVMHSSLFSTCMSTVANHFEHAVRALAGAVFPLFGHVYAGMLFCFLSRLKFFYQPSLHAIAQESNHMTQPQRTHPTRAISANRTRARPVVDASQSRVIIFLKMSGVVVQESSYLDIRQRLARISLANFCCAPELCLGYTARNITPPKPNPFDLRLFRTPVPIFWTGWYP